MLVSKKLLTFFKYTNSKIFDKKWECDIMIT